MWETGYLHGTLVVNKSQQWDIQRFDTCGPNDIPEVPCQPPGSWMTLWGKPVPHDTSDLWRHPKGYPPQRRIQVC